VTWAYCTTCQITCQTTWKVICLRSQTSTLATISILLLWCPKPVPTRVVWPTHGLSHPQWLVPHLGWAIQSGLSHLITCAVVGLTQVRLSQAGLSPHVLNSLLCASHSPSEPLTDFAASTVVIPMSALAASTCKKDTTTSCRGGAVLEAIGLLKKTLCGIGSRSSDTKLALESWTRKAGSSTLVRRELTAL